MRYFECPQEADDLNNSIFLGGGITNCPDWQSEMKTLLSHTDLDLFNPRRAEWDINDKSLEEKQIAWEYKYLNACEAIMFWFPCETLCPIVLYELGFWNGRGNKKLFVGCHPDYSRKNDVIIQTGLANERVKVVFSLQDLAEQVIDYVEG